MSRFLDLYREKKRVEAQMKKIKKKADPDTYWKLDARKKELDSILDEIIKKEKENDSQG